MMEMAEIGATPAGGCNRQALTDEDGAGRDLFVGWCRAAGCRVRIDEVGNLFARRSGAVDDGPPVLMGSHLDTQPTGGRFDGVYGVLAGLEVLETLADCGVTTRAPLELAMWTNEEGARFAPAMLGSGVWAGVFGVEEAHAILDKRGRSVGAELERIGYRGQTPARAAPVAAAFEAHIEQGPILEEQGVRIDPFAGLPSILDALYGLARQHAPSARVTFGDIRAEPGARNTVPERVVLSVDMRHPDQAILDAMDAGLRGAVDAGCAAAGLTGAVREVWSFPPVAFAPECVEAVRGAAERLGYSHLEMLSGAGHDAVYVARVAPTGMIFVPCEKGLSHNEAENAKPEDLEAGANVLLHAVLERAGA
jgi:N-carbamoyl-L-amino-acid hydrolase